MHQSVASGETIEIIEVEEQAEVKRKSKPTVVHHTNNRVGLSRAVGNGVIMQMYEGMYT